MISNDIKEDQDGNKRNSRRRIYGNETMSNEQLAVRIQAGENTSENMFKLWQKNEGFIRKLAMRYRGLAESEDLMQEGYMGLCEAVRQYDSEKGVPFIHYAAFWIKQVMIRYIDNYSTLVRLPVSAREWVRKYNRAVREYRKEWGGWPSEEVLCEILGVEGERLRDIQKSAEIEQITSLDESSGDEGMTLEESIASKEDMEEEAIRSLDAAIMKNELWTAVERLPGQLPAVIRCRYQEGKTLEQTGKSLGVNVSRTRDLEQRGLRRLGAEGKGEHIRKYYEEYLSAGSIRHVGVESFRRTHMSAVELEVFG